MASSSPEGIELGKGSKLLSMELSINKEKVLSIKKEERSYSEEEVLDILREFYKVSIKKDFPLTNTIPLWFEKFKNK